MLSKQDLHIDNTSEQENAGGSQWIWERKDQFSSRMSSLIGGPVPTLQGLFLIVNLTESGTNWNICEGFLLIRGFEVEILTLNLDHLRWEDAHHKSGPHLLAAVHMKDTEEGFFCSWFVCPHSHWQSHSFTGIKTYLFGIPIYPEDQIKQASL